MSIQDYQTPMLPLLSLLGGQEFRNNAESISPEGVQSWAQLMQI